MFLERLTNGLTPNPLVQEVESSSERCEAKMIIIGHLRLLPTRMCHGQGHDLHGGLMLPVASACFFSILSALEGIKAIIYNKQHKKPEMWYLHLFLCVASLLIRRSEVVH